MPDMVNHPPHHLAGGIETIDVIQAKFGAIGAYYFCVGNVTKHTLRHLHKGRPLEDLEKAQWYLNKAIELFPEVDHGTGDTESIPDSGDRSDGRAQ